MVIHAVCCAVHAGGFAELRHPVTGQPLQHDWRGDFTNEAVRTGNSLVLALLFDAGYRITFNNAQVGGWGGGGKQRSLSPVAWWPARPLPPAHGRCADKQPLRACCRLAPAPPPHFGDRI